MTDPHEDEAHIDSLGDEPEVTMILSVQGQSIVPTNIQTALIQAGELFSILRAGERKDELREIGVLD